MNIYHSLFASYLTYKHEPFVLGLSLLNKQPDIDRKVHYNITLQTRSPLAASHIKEYWMSYHLNHNYKQSSGKNCSWLVIHSQKYHKFLTVTLSPTLWKKTSGNSTKCDEETAKVWCPKKSCCCSVCFLFCHVGLILKKKFLHAGSVHYTSKESGV